MRRNVCFEKKKDIPYYGVVLKLLSIYAIIERLYKNRDYLELFARERHQHPRWSIWGNEAEGGSDIYIPGYPVPEYSDRVHFAKPSDLEEGA